MCLSRRFIKFLKMSAHATMLVNSRKKSYWFSTSGGVLLFFSPGRHTAYLFQTADFGQCPVPLPISEFGISFLFPCLSHTAPWSRSFSLTAAWGRWSFPVSISDKSLGFISVLLPISERIWERFPVPLPISDSSLGLIPILLPILDRISVGFLFLYLSQTAVWGSLLFSCLS